MNQEYKVHLSQGQKAKLAKAIRDGSALKLRLSKNALSGNDELLLSPRQIAKLQKAKRNNSGVEISFSKSSIRKSVKHGGSLWTSLFSLGTKALPFVTKGVSKVAHTSCNWRIVCFGKVWELIKSLGVECREEQGKLRFSPMQLLKCFKTGIEIPVKFLVNLINMKEMLTNAPKNFDWKRPSKWERNCAETNKKANSRRFFGNFGVQLEFPWQLNLLQKYLGAAYKLLEKLGEKELAKGCKLLEKRGMGVGQGLQVSQKPFLWQPPPFYGTWEGQGRGAKGKGLLLGDNSPFNHIPILGAIL